MDDGEIDGQVDQRVGRVFEELTQGVEELVVGVALAFHVAVKCRCPDHLACSLQFKKN